MDIKDFKRQCANTYYTLNQLNRAAYGVTIPELLARGKNCRQCECFGRKDDHAEDETGQTQTQPDGH